LFAQADFDVSSEEKSGGKTLDTLSEISGFDRLTCRDMSIYFLAGSGEEKQLAGF
jgi:hypothetical protein